jgi:hypothetical protein
MDFNGYLSCLKCPDIYVWSKFPDVAHEHILALLITSIEAGNLLRGNGLHMHTCS